MIRNSRSPRSEYHVSPTGDDAACGAADRPFRTIQRAANTAQPGDVVTVHGGIYRERIDPPRGGTGDDHRITYQAAPGETVVITGAEPVTNWRHVENDTWTATVPNTLFGDFNPFADVIRGEWYYPPASGWDRRTGAVYLDGEWLVEGRDLEAVLQPVGDEPLWFAHVEENRTVLWAQFPGIDPNRRLVEVNARRCVFYPSQPGINYLTLRGFTMRQAATPWAGAMSEQIGLVGTHWSRGWIIEHNIISHSICTGITLGRYEADWPALPDISQDDAKGYVESLHKAVADGWSRQTVGSHIVRHNRISHCEKAGIHGSLGGIFSLIERNVIHNIALRGWMGGHERAGIKLLATPDTIIRHNHIHHAHMGLWLDWMSQNARVSGNLFHDNCEQDLFVEVNHGPILVDNNIFLSRRAVFEASSGGAYVHNLFTGEIVPHRETRLTPYFRPHTVEMVGLHGIADGDERFFNNIFIAADLSAYDQRHPIWMEGNVFFADARPSTHEKRPLLDPRRGGVTLTESLMLAGVYQPPSDVARSCRLITTELLGRAQTPDQAFTHPDSGFLKIDSDYFGHRRNSANPMPGPFESPMAGISIAPAAAASR